MQLEEQPLLRELDHFPNISVDVPKAIKETPFKLLDAFVDFIYEFVDQPLLPSQVLIFSLEL